mmetsp:Transcript_45505/g.128407  ORF Transcript_45505/g.128407 Transcript_45505/m.128407 type:complete len:155 (-) Transcript_45505:1481-1945(-)
MLCYGVPWLSCRIYRSIQAVIHPLVYTHSRIHSFTTQMRTQVLTHVQGAIDRSQAGRKNHTKQRKRRKEKENDTNTDRYGPIWVDESMDLYGMACRPAIGRQAGRWTNLHEYEYAYVYICTETSESEIDRSRERDCIHTYPVPASEWTQNGSKR